MDNGILGAVTNHDEEAPFLLLDAIAHQGGDTRITVRGTSIGRLQTVSRISYIHRFSRHPDTSSSAGRRTSQFEKSGL